MGEVPEVDHRPYGGRFPAVTWDETNEQLVPETRVPQPTRPADEQHGGTPQRDDHGYRREGVSRIFPAFEPLRNHRRTWVRERETAKDFAEVVRDLSDDYPNAGRVRPVVGNLNTHHGGSFHERFEPAVARAVGERVEFIYTPEHGSRLNTAGIELGVLSRQCLNRRVEDADTLHREVTAWATARDEAAATAHWRFTTGKARIKLHNLYPSISD